MSGYVKIRIKATGQVTDMVPDVARAMLAAGTAEKVDTRMESMAVEPETERAVTSAQRGPEKKKQTRRTA